MFRESRAVSPRATWSTPDCAWSAVVERDRAARATAASAFMGAPRCREGGRARRRGERDEPGRLRAPGNTLGVPHRAVNARAPPDRPEARWGAPGARRVARPHRGLCLG